MQPKHALSLAAAAAAVRAHTSFTTLFVNGVDQGDGTCVRQPAVPQTATDPIRDVTSADMVCGRDGLAPVAFTCPVPAGATLTFEFRAYPDGSQPGVALDPSHKGPCAVYAKAVADMASSSSSAAAAAAGGSWFKLYEAGYDNATGRWCTETLIAARGLLSVALPPGLPAGAYLVRPELLSLHEAQVGIPQFYVGCAQILVASSDGSSTTDNDTLVIPPAYQATIPGYVRPGEPALSFNIYTASPREAAAYPLPGPPVFVPPPPPPPRPASHQHAAAAGADAAAAALSAAAAKAGAALVPSTCLVKNANWCGVEVPRYSTEAGCWDASGDCFRQEAACYAAAPPSGHANCAVWDAKCTAIQAACAARRFSGPPHAGQPLAPVEAAVPGPIPAAQN